MYKVLLFFSLIVFTLSTKSQSNAPKNSSYFDKNGKLTYVESAFYFRESTDTLDYYRSFYADTKNKYFEGSIINYNDTMDYNNKYKGICKWYYNNGVLKVKSEYNDSGILNGLKNEFNIEGKLVKSSIYENGKLKDNQYTEFDGNGNVKKVFEEKFLDNKMNWSLETNETISSKFKIGGFELVNKSNKEFNVLCNKNVDSSSFSVETSINSNYLTPETRCGIVFGVKDKNNYNYFYVSKFRFYSGFVKNGIRTSYFDDFFSYELNGNNWNKIKIQVVRDSLYYIINDKIQALVPNSQISSQQVGLSITNGNVLFDDFYIKEFNRNSFIMNKSNQMFYEINKHLISVSQVNSGLILGKNGFVLTSIKNIHQVNDFLVELNINDTIKAFGAEIFYNSDIYNFTILKLKNYIIQKDFNIEYDYNYIKNVLPEVKIVVCEYEKSELDSKMEFVKISGEGKKISQHSHNYKGIYNLHNCVGAPVFDLTGNILGVISDVDKQNSFKIIPIQQVLGVLFPNPETNEIKRKTNFNILDFNNKIHINVVLIKTF